MGEESKNTQPNVGKAWNPSTVNAFSPMKNRLQQMAASKAQAKQAAYDNSIEHLSAGAEELDRQAYQANDESVTKDYQKEAQKAKVAAMVKYAATRAGQDWSQYQTVQDILTKYLKDVQGTPWISQSIKEFVNSDADAEEFGMAMGWIETDEEDKLNMIDQLLSDVWGTIKYPAEVFGQGISDILGRAERATGADSAANTRALNEFAYSKYGKYIEDMTEDEILRLELDLQLQNITNGSILSDTNPSVAGNGESAYQEQIDRQRLDSGLINAGLGGGLSAAEIAWSVPTLGFSVLGNIPGGREALGWLTEKGQDIGNLSTLIPEFGDYIKSLPEDTQENFKTIGGNTILSLIMGLIFRQALTKKNPEGKGRVYRDGVKKIVDNINSNDFIQSVKEQYKKMNPDVTMPWLKEKLGNFAQAYGDNMTYLLNGEGFKGGSRFFNDAKSGIGQTVEEGLAERGFKSEEKGLKKDILSEQKQSENDIKTKEKLNEEAGRTINPKYIYESQQATDTYSQMDMGQLRGIKDFKTLIATIKNMIKGKASTQDAILDTIDRKYGIGTKYREPLEGRGEVSDIPSNTIQKWFNIMDNYTHFTRDKNILNIMNKVANKNKLTAKDLKQMARAIDRQFKLWKKGKTQEEIKQGGADIEAVRQELNGLIRQDVEGIQEFKDAGIGNVLEYLDKQQSPMIATVEKLVELNNKVNQIKAAIPNKNILNKVGSFLSKFSSKGRAANTIINKMGGPEYMDALLREKNLNRALNAFADLYEKIKIEPDNAESIIKDWIKDKTNKEVVENYGGFVEGEVLEPDFNPGKSPNEFLEELLETVEIEKPENFMLKEDKQYNGQDPIDYTDKTVVDSDRYPGRPGKTTESYKGQPKGEGTTPEAWNTTKETPNNKTIEDYVGKYGQSLESFKAQLEKAGLKTDLIDAFLKNIAQKNFKVGGTQGTLFEIPSETKTTTKNKTPLKKAKKTTQKKPDSNPK